MTTPEPPLGEEELAEMEARAEAATPQEWEMYLTIHGDPYVVEKGFGPTTSTISRTSTHTVAIVSTSPDDYGRANADFIAHARTDVPRLIAALRASRAEVEELKAKLAWVDEQIDCGEL